jgi:hypothetical protein
MKVKRRRNKRSNIQKGKECEKEEEKNIDKIQLLNKENKNKEKVNES